MEQLAQWFPITVLDKYLLFTFHNRIFAKFYIEVARSSTEITELQNC